MGKMKDIATKQIDAADALWAKALYHNDQFHLLKGDHVSHHAHEIEYHNHAAFEAECDWIDATRYYDQEVVESLRGFDDSFLDLPKEHECL